MPLLRICAHGGCSEIAEEGSRFCKRHASDADIPKYRERYDTHGGKSAAKRGYGRKWQKLRAWYIAGHPWCEECLKHGRFTKATDVDHIVPHKGDPVLLFDACNLQSLCHACHSRKTVTEDGGFGRKISERGREV